MQKLVQCCIWPTQSTYVSTFFPWNCVQEAFFLYPRRQKLQRLSTTMWGWYERKWWAKIKEKKSKLSL